VEQKKAELLELLNNEEPEVITEEVKVKVAKRVPPGDRWTPLDNTSVILESLTDVLEYVYQKNGNTQFYMDAREGFTYVIKRTKSYRTRT
jgi:hypothetical protein